MNWCVAIDWGAPKYGSIACAYRPISPMTGWMNVRRPTFPPASRPERRSSAGVLIKLVDWPPGAIWSARCAIAAAVLYGVRRPSLAIIARAEWAAAAALAATTGLFIAANKLTTPANAILIQYSAPVWVALLGPWFLGERVTRLDWLAIAVVLCGIALFFLEDLTFDHVVDGTRRELARRYLGDPAISIQETAHLLAFGDLRGFYRAFKRWEGRTPAEFRRHAGAATGPIGA